MKRVVSISSPISSLPSPWSQPGSPWPPWPGPASLPDRLIGRPTGELAGALAALVVAAPIAYLLWRRQARRRKTFPATPGWPVYLAIIELVFLIAFLAAVDQLAGFLAGDGDQVDWTDLLIYGGIVVFHWWAERRERPQGEIADLPRLVGSGVALVALTIGLIGTLEWLFSVAYDALWDLGDIPDPAVPIALAVAGAAIWAWRWLPAWDEEPNVLRNFYLGFVTAFSLTMAIGAGVTMIATLLTFAFGEGGPAADHFDIFPLALAFSVVGSGLWYHHSHRLGPGRTGGRRGYEYAMAATGLGALVGSATALVNAVFTPTLAGADSGSELIVLGCAVIAAGWVWLTFWRKAQAAPRAEEARALPRRVYLIGMAIILGLTAAGALIAVLVVVFRAAPRRDRGRRRQPAGSGHADTDRRIGHMASFRSDPLRRRRGEANGVEALRGDRDLLSSRQTRHPVPRRGHSQGPLSGRRSGGDRRGDGNGNSGRGGWALFPGVGGRNRLQAGGGEGVLISLESVRSR